MIGNTAKVWSCCSSGSDSDMLRVWFSCSPFVPSEHGVKMTDTLEVCTKDTQHTVVRFFVSEGMKRDRDPSTIGCQVRTELIDAMKCVRVDRNV
jgi:hypothetical protein